MNFNRLGVNAGGPGVRSGSSGFEQALRSKNEAVYFRESDLLIVLRDWESQSHGEGADR
jgi:hypothetical protein